MVSMCHILHLALDSKLQTHTAVIWCHFSKLTWPLCVLLQHIRYQIAQKIIGGKAVSKVIHKASIEVNGESHNVAVAESVASGPRAGPDIQIQEFKADHPFLFLIRDKWTKLILFMGRLMKPS